MKVPTEVKMCMRCGLFHLDYYLQSYCIACRKKHAQQQQSLGDK